ncbi:hypothetical protein LFL96_31310 [Paraburkholderia sp. D15]|uniref:phage neck terminator protein n=1 Tax=Paraburkholderia sp. D15 TaxID=2880218 RepID=UPI00247913CA|nr:hypothetical protein [Paraburkholderia sp. D15]WGS52675.1 hypothetical protein LFL96_31310 [Paraburkholderia sp. D15]
MTNDSTTLTYLLPVAASLPLQDAALDAMLQSLIAGVTGLPSSAFQSQWPATVPPTPDPSQNWCAIGVTAIDKDFATTVMHAGNDDGTDEFYRDEILTVLASFYGPAGMQYASQTGDGLFVAQNQDMLTQNSMGLVDIGSIVTNALQSLTTQQWTVRYDLTFRLRRQVHRTYKVLNILSAHGSIDNDPDTQPFVVQQ